MGTDVVWTGRPDKHRAIVRAANLVFGRDGFARATVDAIAREAGVSKKTIYNHFDDKAALFRLAALEATHELSDAIALLADRHLRKILDLERDLIDFGVDRVQAIFNAPEEHAAIARTVRAEVKHLPREVVDAWLEAGPVRSQRDIAAHFLAMRERGLLDFEDADKAAAYYTLLSFTPIAERTFLGALPIGDEEIQQMVAEGVRMFLRLYGAETN
ncbi:TetR/AcrR family transcriptional regulator [Glycomyces xiaoerkulensis]|uniref:TetR/AcrR family transcriptional regulator n=1 Tax=Glycomyces xiaoerkulensis TaxID=2038139 RepID=UPI000C258EF9|nr:TetR/AcrR family transcriptional regulator [Glycomyces xiaoerkulensis]